jgi:hypothetical protein
MSAMRGVSGLSGMRGMSPMLTRWIFALVLVSAVIVVFAPRPEFSTSRAIEPEAAWSVPGDAAPVDAPRLAAALSTSALWGKQLDAEAANAASTGWRLAGITGSGRERVVLVQFRDDKILPLKAGDKFPDDTPIAEVRDNGVCVLLAGKRRFLPLDGQAAPIIW